jgi:hypothetical protein
MKIYTITESLAIEEGAEIHLHPFSQCLTVPTILVGEGHGAQILRVRPMMTPIGERIYNATLQEQGGKPVLNEIPHDSTPERSAIIVFRPTSGFRGSVGYTGEPARDQWSNEPLLDAYEAFSGHNIIKGRIGHSANYQLVAVVKYHEIFRVWRNGAQIDGPASMHYHLNGWGQLKSCQVLEHYNSNDFR